VALPIVANRQIRCELPRGQTDGHERTSIGALAERCDVPRHSRSRTPSRKRTLIRPLSPITIYEYTPLA
jgi:hypothetical protein